MSALSAHWLTNAHTEVSLLLYLKEQVPAEVSAELNLQVQERKKPKKDIWDRTEETPYKYAKETSFFPLPLI